MPTIGGIVSSLLRTARRMNAHMAWTEIARTGAFTTAQVARLIGRPPVEVASWLRGARPLILSDFDPINGHLVVSFEALIEARAISHFIAEGFSKRKLRGILAELRRKTGDRHPLARDRAFVTEGFRLIERSDEGRLINLANDCYLEPELMRPALKGHVQFDGGRAAWLQPDPENLPLIRIDPRRAFGRPVLVDRGRSVPTTALAVTAEEEGRAAAADWYEVSEAGVDQAVEFEHRLAA